MWLFTVLLFDRQIYMVFTPGQLKVRTEIGGGEKVYDAVGMTLEKQRSDLFRHWLLGMGSGDLIVRHVRRPGPPVRYAERPVHRPQGAGHRGAAQGEIGRSAAQ